MGAMYYGGIATVTVVKAPYSLPSYALLNSAGYSFMNAGYGARLTGAYRVNAGFMTAFASALVSPSGYAETTLDPNNTTGVSSGFRGATENLYVSSNGYATYAPHNVITVAMNSTGSAIAEPKFTAVPEGDTSVLYPEVNLQSDVFDYRIGGVNLGASYPGMLWSGSSLYHQNELYMMWWPGFSQFQFLSLVDMQPSVSAFLTATLRLGINSANRRVYMLQTRTTGDGGPRMFVMLPQPYDPDVCPPAEYIYSVSFGIPALDTALQSLGDHAIKNWRGGFIIRLNTGGTGPTGAQYEFAITDLECKKFWLLKLVPGDAATKAAMDAGGTPQVKIDADGNLFWTNQLVANKNDVFFSGYEHINDWPVYQLANIPPITLPCFNPCLPQDLGLAYMEQKG